MERQNEKTSEESLLLKTLLIEAISTYITVGMPEEVDIQLKYLFLHVHVLHCISTVAQPIEMFLLYYKWNPSSVSAMLSDPSTTLATI